jgi:diacylglycerol O-acyltransferase / wax synthase
MSAQDASFLNIESDRSPMHVGGVSIFEGPAPEPARFAADVALKLDQVPRYRQVVRTVARGFASPVWVDDPYFNIGYHVRRTALPAPGSDGQLQALVGRVMSQNLDRDKPLWEMWVVEGLNGGRWALLSKVHHSMVDGVAATDLMAVLLDTERDPGGPDAPSRWAPGPYPSEAQVLAAALGGGSRVPIELARGALRGLRDPRTVAADVDAMVRGLIASAGLARRPPDSSLNGSLGPHRRWGWARGTLADVHTIRQALGGTVNDVVLAAISGGFRELLLTRGEPVDRTLRSLVPVSVRRPGERGTYNNRVSAMFAELPIDIADPVARLASVTAQMAGLKDSKQAVAGEVLTSLSGFAPPMLLMLGARVASRLPQRNVNTGTTNVPGPQFPLYAGGRRMLESFPYIPLFANVRLAVAIFSYDGQLSFGVSGDYDTTADLQVLCDGIEQGLAELVQAAADAAPH